MVLLSSLHFFSPPPPLFNRMKVIYLLFFFIVYYDVSGYGFLLLKLLDIPWDSVNLRNCVFHPSWKVLSFHFFEYWFFPVVIIMSFSISDVESSQFIFWVFQPLVLSVALCSLLPDFFWCASQFASSLQLYSSSFFSYQLAS